ncbi:MAG: hypothetical protein PVI30_02220 [Myxococcales bacterium]|jgi:hypothetical protein
MSTPSPRARAPLAALLIALLAPTPGSAQSIPDAGVPGSAPGSETGPEAEPDTETESEVDPVPEPDPASVSDTAARTALARSLFSEGVEALEVERWEEAEDCFRRTLALKSTPAVRYNLAYALVRLGQLVEGVELLRTVERDDDAPDELRALAERTRAEHQGRIGKLTITVTGDDAGHELWLDGRPLLPEAIDVPTPIDPGEHRIRATLDGEEVAAVSSIVGEGEQKRALLPIPPRVGQADVGAPPPSVTAAAAPSSADRNAALDAGRPPVARDDGDGGLLRSPWLWVGVGAAVIAGVVAGVAASSSDDTRLPEGESGSLGLVRVGR